MNRVIDWGWALLALDFAAGAIGDKLPILVDAAGKEGTLAAAAVMFDADKYVKGVEDVAIILALKKYLETTGLGKPAGKEGGGFGL